MSGTPSLRMTFHRCDCCWTSRCGAQAGLEKLANRFIDEIYELLTSSEFWVALVDKSLNGFAMVCREEAERLEPEVQIHPELCLRPKCGVQDTLGARNRLRCSRLEVAPPAIDRCIQIFGRHGFGDQTDIGGFTTRQCIAGEQKASRASHSDQTGPQQRSAVAGDEADFDVRVRDLRRLDHHRNITTRGNCRAVSHRVSVDPANHRLFALQNAEVYLALLAH